jgi:hypothetical protein
MWAAEARCAQELLDMGAGAGAGPQQTLGLLPDFPIRGIKWMVAVIYFTVLGKPKWKSVIMRQWSDYRWPFAWS